MSISRLLTHLSSRLLRRLLKASRHHLIIFHCHSHMEVLSLIMIQMRDRLMMEWPSLLLEHQLQMLRSNMNNSNFSLKRLSLNNNQTRLWLLKTLQLKKNSQTLIGASLWSTSQLIARWESQMLSVNLPEEISLVTKIRIASLTMREISLITQGWSHSLLKIHSWRSKLLSQMMDYLKKREIIWGKSLKNSKQDWLD